MCNFVGSDLRGHIFTFCSELLTFLCFSLSMSVSPLLSTFTLEFGVVSFLFPPNHFQ